MYLATSSIIVTFEISRAKLRENFLKFLGSAIFWKGLNCNSIEMFWDRKHSKHVKFGELWRNSLLFSEFRFCRLNKLMYFLNNNWAKIQEV